MAIEKHLAITFQVEGVITGPVNEDFETASAEELAAEFSRDLRKLIVDECPTDARVNVTATARLIDHDTTEGTATDGTQD